MSRFAALLVLALVVFTQPSFSQTAQQIEQFSKLTPQQQELVARQLGVDISVLRQGGQSLTEPNQPVETSEFPRGTQFDQFGNPLNQFEQLIEPTEDDKEELTLFGYDLFAHGPSTFSPTLTGDVPNDYILGTGDEITLQLFGKDNAQYTLMVDINGNILVPELGPVSLTGKSYEEAKLLIRNRVEQALIGVEVSISLTKLKSIRVFVSGEAHKPGAYNLNALSTVTNGIYAAGGVSDIASLRQIKVNRNGQTAATLDLYDLLINGDARNDIILRHGDVIHIPTVNKTVTIDGEVRRPAIYELANERSLADVLTLAGNTKPRAFRSEVSVQRVANNALIQLTANADDQTFTVKAGDVINVPTLSERVQNAVTLLGAVVRPGHYQWSKGMTVRQLLGDTNESLLTEADTSYILVVRQPSVSSLLSFHQVNLNGQKRVELEPNDSIMVFSTKEVKEFNHESLEDFIATADTIEDNRKTQLSSFIEQRLQFQQFGVIDQPQDELSEDTKEPLVSLTEEEKEAILATQASNIFSRKNLLTPVLEKAKANASFFNRPKLVRVGGAVRVPGDYPLAENATVKEAIEAAGGMLPQAFAERSEITRIGVDASGAETITHVLFNPLQEIENSSGGTLLQPGDEINVFTIPDWKEEIRVTLRGEVKFPGEYAVRRGETLDELLTRAGGYTEYADVDALVFTREKLREQERVNLKRLAEELRKDIASQSLRKDKSAGAMVSYDEARKLLRDLTQAEAVGRLVLESGEDKSALNVLLEDQDALYVPRTSQSINVIGEVYVPTSHLFANNVTFEDYIEMSGGYRPLADKKRVYVVRANGSVALLNNQSSFWFSGGNETVAVKPGDTIVVPYDTNNVDAMTVWTNATQILYQLAVAVAAIGSL